MFDTGASAAFLVAEELTRQELDLDQLEAGPNHIPSVHQRALNSRVTPEFFDPSPSAALRHFIASRAPQRMGS
jgi:hypothetical protein